MKQFLLAFSLIISGFAVNAQISLPIALTFTANSGTYVTPPGGGSPCASVVTVSYTSIAGGAPSTVVLSHTFNLGDTYTFLLTSPAPSPMIEFSFDVPCRPGLIYGLYSESTVDSNPEYSSEPNGGGETMLVIYHSGTNYSYQFENPTGVYP
ncbi:MAG: hypothetical protein P4L41_02760 [Flavipsychrobacter sp.]|nr:hypothetical protein [Flavipsychrobacter sp.]